MMIKTYLVCVCVKHTKIMLSPILVIEVPGEYYLANEVEKLTGIKVDGSTNYVDWCEV